MNNLEIIEKFRKQIFYLEKEHKKYTDIDISIPCIDIACDSIVDFIWIVIAKNIDDDVLFHDFVSDIADESVSNKDILDRFSK